MLNLLVPGQSEKLKQLIMLGPKTNPTYKEHTNTVIKLHVYEELSGNEFCTQILEVVSNNYVM